MPGFDWLGIPLHPLVVHFPIVLAVLLPIFAMVALLAIRKGTTFRWAWALPLGVAAALVASSLAATKTGEREEDRVERVVSEDVLHGHEEAAERFLALSGVLLAVATAGLAPGVFGQAARIVTTLGAVALLAAGVQVGHSGGELVYRHGAASAYTTGTGPDAVASGGGEQRDDD